MQASAGFRWLKVSYRGTIRSLAFKLDGNCITRSLANF
jgi:hypothetical protein